MGISAGAGRWLGRNAALLIVGCAIACGGARDLPRNPAAGEHAVENAAAPRSPEPCALVTPADVARISAYPDAVRRETGSESSCWLTVPEGRFGLAISIGQYVPTPFLGGRDLDLEPGVRGRVSDAGWLNQLVLSDGTSITLLIDGSALSQNPDKSYQLKLGDGRTVDLTEQYEAYAKTIVSRLK